jgi:CubicO group peptidase (beta-lactamase class C family)
VTVRRLLSHTAGLSLQGYPGWGPDAKLPTLEASLSGATNGSGDVRLIAEPGTEWRYSGGGYTLLQLLIEEVTGRGFADYMREEVLRPVGMTRSDFVVTGEIEAGSSLAFDEFAEPTPSPRFTALAAAGLHTTVEDLATFAAAAVEGPGGELPGRGVLRPETVAMMIAPVLASDGTYGLGYGVEPLGEDLVMVGHNGGNRGWHAAFWVVPSTGEGFVLVTNGSNGWTVHRQVHCDWIQRQTGTRPACKKPVGVVLVGVVLDEGVEAAVRHYRALKREAADEYEFDEWELNGLGYGLLSRDRIEDAIAIFELNVEEYPDFSNPYDSLGEAYMIAGDRGRAIENYEKSLELNPANDNARQMLERLGQG